MTLRPLYFHGNCTFKAQLFTLRYKMWSQNVDLHCFLLNPPVLPRF